MRFGWLDKTLPQQTTTTTTNDDDDHNDDHDGRRLMESQLEASNGWLRNYT